MRRPGTSKTYEVFCEAVGVADAAPRPPKRKREAPLSIRFNPREKEALIKAAKGQPMGAFIKARVFGDAPPLTREHPAFKTDHKALASVLGALGRSRISQNLNQIAKACHLGILPLTPELVEDIEDACRDVRLMRQSLLRALKNQ